MLLKERDPSPVLLRICCILIAAGMIAAHYLWEPWGFYRNLPDEEATLRTDTVILAQEYLGCREDDGSHRKIIDLYNSHKPLAMDYKVTYTDSWCAAFVSAVAIEGGLTDIIPTECSCERQIGLWQQLGRWQESDSYMPDPGDLIYYDWDADKQGDCTGWSDHVGMVAGVKWPLILVVEGNREDAVTYRTILADDYRIRGYGLPDYRFAANENRAVAK